MSETENTTPEQSTTPEPSDLTINDLNAVKTVIDVAIARGAFKGNEMVSVGQTYNKLTSFLDEIAKQAAAAQAANPQAGG